MARRLLKMTSWAIFKTISFSSEIVKFSFLIFHLKKIGQKKEAVSKKEAVGDAKHFFFWPKLGIHVPEAGVLRWKNPRSLHICYCRTWIEGDSMYGGFMFFYDHKRIAVVM